jgi:hypothetical protein
MTKQEWWMPLKAKYEEGELNFLCDHLGDANETMTAMWKEICRLRPELPKQGFKDNEDI